MDADAPSDAEYRSLAEFRHALRRFLAFSERAARDDGLTPAQHQLMLAVRGAEAVGRRPSTTDIAESLQVRLHSAGELVDRAVANGLVERVPDADDGRRALVLLTDTGRARLEQLSVLHRHELRRFRSEMARLLDELGDGPMPPEEMGGESPCYAHLLDDGDEFDGSA